MKILLVDEKNTAEAEKAKTFGDNSAQWFRHRLRDLKYEVTLRTAEDHNGQSTTIRILELQQLAHQADITILCAGAKKLKNLLSKEKVILFPSPFYLHKCPEIVVKDYLWRLQNEISEKTTSFDFTGKAFR
jgi:hypothetical protein